MIRTSNAPTPPTQQPTRRHVARRLGALLSFSVLALHGVAHADPPAPPDSAFTSAGLTKDGFVKDINIMADKRYTGCKIGDCKSYRVHTAGDPWVDGSTAKVIHRVDTFTKQPVPLWADLIWKGKSKEGIPYYFRGWVQLFKDGSFAGSSVDVVLFGDRAEKAAKEAADKYGI